MTLSLYKKQLLFLFVLTLGSFIVSHKALADGPFPFGVGGSVAIPATGTNASDNPLGIYYAIENAQIIHSKFEIHITWTGGGTPTGYIRHQMADGGGNCWTNNSFPSFSGSYSDAWNLYAPCPDTFTDSSILVYANSGSVQVDWWLTGEYICNTGYAGASCTTTNLPPGPFGISSISATCPPGSTQVTLSWSASANAATYNVYRNVNGGPWSKIFPDLTVTSVGPFSEGVGVHLTFYVEAVNPYGTAITGVSSDIYCPPPVNPRTLTVNSSGAASVAITSSTGQGGTTNYSLANIADGTNVSLTAPGSVGVAYFSSWTGCSSVSGNTCSRTMDADRTVTANYAITTGSLSAAPTSIISGGTITVTWSSVSPPSTTDWIGLYTIGAADTAYTAFEYTSSCTTVAGAGSPANGNCPFTITPTGTFEFRLFAKNTYTKVATSNTVTVLQSGTLTASPGTVGVGSAETATFANVSPFADNDWIGYFHPADPDTGYVDWNYAGLCTKTAGSGRANGSCNFTIGAAGTYEFRYFHSGNVKVATSNQFTAAVSAANLGSSSKTIGAINGTTYVSNMAIFTGDTITWKIVIKNTGTASATINNITDTLSSLLSQPTSCTVGAVANWCLRVDKGSGYVAASVSGTAPNLTLLVSGAKAADATSWIVLFDTKVNSLPTNCSSSISNTAAINYTDPQGANSVTKSFGPIILCGLGNKAPTFKEIAP